MWKMSSRASSTDRFDAVRAENPELGFALYAMEPGSDATLEIYTPDGQVFSFAGRTAAEAIDKAFPTPPAPAEDTIFD
jgi:hypothetical protein